MISKSKAVERNSRNDEAIENLKRSGTYDSLDEAFKNASGMSLKDSETPSLFSGGGYEEITVAGSDSATQNYLGDGVAISGNTAVIGAGSHDHGGFIDPGAAYVFVRDGSTWTQQAKLVASDPANFDYFGVSVAISGDTIVVGSLYDNSPAVDQGSAYVFTRSGTTWTQQQKLTALDGVAGDVFGRSVAISGDTLVVGANGDDVGANVDQGSAYVFTRSGTTWTEQQRLTASDGAASDFFGISVSISDNTILVGAYFAQVGVKPFEGAAYVFTGSGATWTEEQKLTASDGAASDGFGISVAVSGNTAVVGSLNDDVGASVDQGSAYVFTRSGATWTEQQKLTASDGATGDGFGTSVAISGETVVVGAPYDEIGANSNQGSAYRFTRSGSTWTEQTKLLASDGASNDQFGEAITVDGDTIVVGALGDDVDGKTDQGSARIFQTKTSVSKIVASDGATADQFGFSVAISGDTAVIGAYGDDASRGSAYVFIRSGLAWIQQQKLTASDGAAGHAFGGGVAISGDSIAVGAYGVSGNTGAAYVFTRSGSVWTEQQKINFPGTASQPFFAFQLALDGDTLVVGADGDDIGGTDRGSASVFVRSGGAWSLQQKLTPSDAANGDQFGRRVSISGDTIIAGSPLDDDAGTSSGSAYVFTRSGTTWTQQAKLTASDAAAGDNFGESVSLSSDTAIVGARLADIGGNANQGAAYIFTRSGSVWTERQKLIGANGAANDQFATSVSISGGNLVIGAPGFDTSGAANRGATYLYTRAGDIWLLQRELLASDGAAEDQFGFYAAVSSNTMIVGAYLDDIGANANQGSAYMYYWGPTPTTASGSSLSGRVLDTNGRGLVNATVILMDTMGVERVAQTGSFGRFGFNDLPSGETYILSVNSRRFSFSTQVIGLQTDLTDLVIQATGRNQR